jgi:hypothetical protein
MDALPEFRRDVLVSIRPNFASKILDGDKTVELRRKFPEVGAMGMTALIYSSSPVSAIVGYARFDDAPIFEYDDAVNATTWTLMLFGAGAVPRHPSGLENGPEPRFPHSSKVYQPHLIPRTSDCCSLM